MDLYFSEWNDQKNRENFNGIIQRIKDADIIGFGSPAYHMDILEPMRLLFGKMMASKETYHFRAFLYLNYAGIKCGKCGKECPVGAISLRNYAGIDFAKCIHCYHCTVACKMNAVEARIDKLDNMIEMNKKIIGTENPQNDIYI